jgi:DNA-binding CsgD family transcriptional regulator
VWCRRCCPRTLGSIENRLRLPLGGLGPGEVAALAAALTEGPLDDEAVQRLYRSTGGHPLYLRTVLSEGFEFDPGAPGRLALPRSLAAAVGDHLRVLPPETRTILETEVAHLVGKGPSNPEVGAELFISRKAVEYHLGNIYAKCGLQGRQQLRRFVEQWRQPATV